MITIKGVAIGGLLAVLAATQGCSSGMGTSSWYSSEDRSAGSQVRAKIANDDVLKGYDIGVVTTGNNSVRLTGLVDTRLERQKAVEDAEQVAGISSVTDDIALLNGI